MLTRRHLLATSLAIPFVRPSRADAPAALRAAGAQFEQLHSLLVSKNGETVFAEAFRGPGLDRPANIKSCSKSIVALLLGAAIARNEVTGLDATLGDVAPALIPATADPAVRRITLGDLASLRAGLEPTSGPNYGAWVSAPNWTAYALSRPLVATPGGRMLYSTGSTHVLGAALTVATGKSLLTQARERLGRPLGIDIPAWTRDPQGYYLGGNEMALAPTAMLRLAQVLCDGGRFDGDQVIPETWLRQSTQPLTRSPYSGLDYGYGWFLSRSGFAIARGYGGQVIAFHPARQLAVAITSDPTRPARSEGYFGDLADLLDTAILSL